MYELGFFLKWVGQFDTESFNRRLKDTISNSYISCFVDLFYPRNCLECDKILLAGCDLLCHVCMTDLPKCQFGEFRDNRAEALFKGRVEIAAVASLLYFRKKGMVQRMMHALKYHGREDIGRYLGLMLGSEMKTSKRFESADLIIPVPLHPRRKRSRGYNQSTAFGRALSESLEIPFLENALLRRRAGRSQTQKSRIARNRNLEDAFLVNIAKPLKNKHVLIVDDIITSGATLEICARKILELPGTRVSLASMAFTL